ncbi:porin [Pelagimonas varians]|uniref:Porin domain-containing protein n=1 Tax=Pelagimonas varians TaxID=696760 RepID=A0A238K452_9RHOB|nr:porin [Pelagimonas varians]PYG30418.1 outer membrane protein OmpU [Pelagimonas varians]SMX37680.1 hypothetical protein PEV8663_01164 [Pelagimonas varians]
MKNILLATTALVATASTAFAAGVEVSGYAEMGIIGGDPYDNAEFHTDVDVTFSMSGEADNGLTFGASVDLDESQNANAFNNRTQGGESIFIAYGAGRLSMGDVDGAFDSAMQEAIIGSSINDDHEHLGYNGNGGLDGAYDGQIATASYAFSGFTGYLSAEIHDGDRLTGDDGAVYDPIWGVGVKYTADLAGLALNLGLGYQAGDSDAAEDAYAGADITITNNDSLSDIVGLIGANAREDIWGISVGTTFNNGLVAILNYSAATYAESPADTDGFTGNDETHWGIALGYSMNALTIGANYGEYQNFLGLEDLTGSGWGFVADYDMGGGLEAQFGYGSSRLEVDNGDNRTNDTWSLGLAMSF